MKRNKLATRAALLFCIASLAGVISTGAYTAASATPPSSHDEPELGRFVPPAQVKVRLEQRDRAGQPTRRVDEADLLATFDDMRIAGVADDKGLCWTVYDEAVRPDLACTTAEFAPNNALTAIRSFSLESANPETVSGMAPPGTKQIGLSAADGTEVRVPAYLAGSRWQGRSFYVAAWPVGVPTTVRAYSADGRVLREAESQPLLVK